MLSDEHLQLLTGFVDGELTKQQRKEVLRLLKRSPAARKLLRQLKGDSGILKSAPRLKAPEEFMVRLLRLVVHKNPQGSVANITFPRWAGIALVALLLLVFTAASYFWFKSASNSDLRGSITDQQAKTDSKSNGPSETGISSFDITDLANEKTRRGVEKTLASDNSFLIELTSSNHPKAIAYLAQTLRKGGVEVLIDAEVKKRLGSDKKDQQFLLFLEDIFGHELSMMLEELHLHQQTSEPVITHTVIKPLTVERRTEIANILGVSPWQLQPLPAKGKADNGKEAQKVEPPRQAQATPRLALLVPWGPNSPDPGRSAEVKQFMAARTTPRPGTLQVVIILSAN